MSLLFSRSCEYGLQAVVYLAQHAKNDPIYIKDIAKELNIPFYYLAKIMQDLAKNGLLNSQKGPKGGFSLAKPANQIYLFDVVRILDGEDLFNECVMGMPGCGGNNPCPVHDVWGGIREQVKQMLSVRTIADMKESLNY